MSTDRKDKLLAALNEALLANHLDGVGVAIVVADDEGCRTIIGKRGNATNALMDSALVCLTGSWWQVAYESNGTVETIEGEVKH